MLRINTVIKWVLGAIAFGLVLYVGLYAYGTQSEAYRFASAWIRESPELQARIGPVQRTRLDPVRGYSERFAGSDRRVRLFMNVTGERGQVRLKLALRKVDGTWVVTESSIDSERLTRP